MAMSVLNGSNGRAVCKHKCQFSPSERNSHHVGQIVEQLGGFLVMTTAKVEELRRALNERGGGPSTQKFRMSENIVQEPCMMLFDVSK